VTEFQTPVGLDPPANDIAYGGGVVVPGTLDLDPSTAGVQTIRTVLGGTFAAAPDGTVQFTPAEGFSGEASTQYVLEDSAGRTSNAATLTVTVKPNPTGTLVLASYEDGLDGAGTESWGGAGSVSQSSDWASDGSSSLRIDVTGEGWFRAAQFGSPVDVSTKSAVRIDLHTLGAQTYRKLALQLSDGTWCEGSGQDGNTPPNSTDTVSVDFSKLTCSGPDLTTLKNVYFYLQPGTFYVDNLRGE
jgi:mannan endo-1,4-beta-mannosidase